MFYSFKNTDITEEISQGEEYRGEMIKDELTKRVNSDIEQRLMNEFGMEVKADAEVGVNDEGKITGVTAIKIYGNISERAAARLCEVYGVEEIISAGSNKLSQREE